MSDHIKYVPGMPWKLIDGVRVPDLDAIRATPFLTPYTASQFGPRPKLRIDPDEGMTATEFLSECDINVIMRRYLKTGQLPASIGPGAFGDFSHINDYLDAYNQVTLAQEQFGELPALVRERFHQNPGELLAFLADDKNRDEAITLGLIPKPAPSQTTPATQPAPPPPDKAKPND